MIFGSQQASAPHSPLSETSDTIAGASLSSEESFETTTISTGKTLQPGMKKLQQTMAIGFSTNSGNEEQTETLRAEPNSSAALQEPAESSKSGAENPMYIMQEEVMSASRMTPDLVEGELSDRVQRSPEGVGPAPTHADATMRAYTMLRPEEKKSAIIRRSSCRKIIQDDVDLETLRSSGIPYEYHMDPDYIVVSQRYHRMLLQPMHHLRTGNYGPKPHSHSAFHSTSNVAASTSLPGHSLRQHAWASHKSGYHVSSPVSKKWEDVQGGAKAMHDKDQESSDLAWTPFNEHFQVLPFLHWYRAGAG